MSAGWPWVRSVSAEQCWQPWERVPSVDIPWNMDTRNESCEHPPLDTAEESARVY